MYDVHMSLLIKGGRVVSPDGVVAGDISVDNGVITAIGPDLPRTGEIVDAGGCYVLPGGVDPHCHLMDGLENSTRAAALGGTTTALSFSLPVDDEHPVSAFRRARSKVERGESLIDVGLHAMCYRPNRLSDQDIERLAELGADAIKIFLAYPELDIMATGTSLYQAMVAAARVGLPVQVHCEDGELIEALVLRAAEREEYGAETFAGVRPPVVEDVAVHRALTISALAGADCYITHVSSAGAIDHIRAARGRTDRDVFAEVCLHHALLDAGEYRGPAAGALLVAPPLREKDHVEAIREALADGTIDTVGSDHSQSRTPVDERICPHGDGCYGIAGIGARMPLLLSWGMEHGIPIERLAHLLATGPARAFGYGRRKGVLSVGWDGDVVVWDPTGDWTVEAGSFPDGTGTSPYLGRSVRGRVQFVALRGRPLVRDGAPAEPLIAGRLLTPRGMKDHEDG
jgi:dihydropyrimidinase